MPKKNGWLFYPSFLRPADTQQAIQEVKLLLYGTPDNVKEAAPLDCVYQRRDNGI